MPTTTSQCNNSKMTTCFVRKAGLLPKAVKKMSSVCTETNIPEKWLTFRQPMSRCNSEIGCFVT